ncbi:MAG TPA: HAMP domain-containing sensor histidine kinase [Baekduia sp.]|uniref:sensor histidine kinase n=1 Tax=Baekduia sp. TaxID=2600305 RepID=UPI002BB6D33F|nr:HAMP domain-containing sensor histidine kinase [Baekduia sp.]HMJ36857.1 HAMP domain-containing sensor histidine kinase [Baekduia sp.]
MTAGDPAPRAQDGLEAFAALAAHQLGEAVALMRGAASVLENERVRIGPGGQDALRALNAGGERAQRYVDDLLDVVRASSAVEGPTSADLDSALDAAAAELEPFLARERVQLRREPLPRAALDAREAQRLFTHLLRSALAAGASRVLLAGGTGDDGVTVEMLDDGTPAADGSRPFEPFARPRGRGPLIGAGVSLPVCRRIVERRGGTIAMATREDGATLVTIRLASAG